MDLDEFRSILMNSGVDVWTLIDTAISVASVDYETELKNRRDAIVERFYAPVVPHCRNCDRNHHQKTNCNGIDECNGCELKKGFHSSPVLSVDRTEDDEEQSKVLAIKKRLEDPNQPEDCLVDLLQSLADMDITFKALKETDIGRHVNRLRKHSSNELQRLAKLLVRKWKDLVDEWVRLNTPPGETDAPLLGGYGDSPYQNHQKKSTQNGHQQVRERTQKVVPRRDSPTKPAQWLPESASYLTPKKEVKNDFTYSEKLASATKRLHENYQEAQHAKKQRTIQVMELHDPPKPKNTYFVKNRATVQAKHW